MDDPDIIAVLTPCGGYKGKNAETAFAQDHNAVRYHDQADGPVTTEPAPDDRETTPAPLSPSMQRSEPFGRLILRFSDSLINAADGIFFGKDKKSCDILIHCEGALAVSRRHFTFVVKEDGSWYLEDFFSTFGTAVSYDGKAACHRRTYERWIIAHPSKTRKRWDELIVYAGDIAFKIDFPNQEAGHPIYQANLKAFIQKSRAALPALSALGLDSQQTTAAPSQIMSANRFRQPIYIEYDEVGRGAFGTVLKVMSSRDGLFYAMKKFFRPSEGKNKNKRKRMQDSDAWLENKRKEADIMRKSAHPNVMPLIDVIEEADAFSIVMPYYKLGGLQDYCPADDTEVYETIFLQILLALSWFHSQGVVHRDIKPENFLIADEAPLKIIVADFGLSNVSVDQVFTTFCGTLLYCAPEVFPGNSNGYGPKADMWSLGVMMLKLMFDLPNDPSLPPCYNQDDLREWIADWSRMLHKRLKNSTGNNILMADILVELIEVDPDKRLTADECLQKGLEVGLFRRNRHGQIVLQNTTDVNTPASVCCQFDSLGDFDGLRTPTMQSPLSKKTESTGIPTNISFLDGELWGGGFEHQRCNDDEVARAKVSSVDSHSISGPPMRRQKTSNASNQFHTVQDLDFDVERYAGIDSSLEWLLAPLRGLEKEQNASIRQESPASRKIEDTIVETEVWGSVERRVFELLA